MTLVITALAAIIATAILYVQPAFSRRMHIGTMSLIYWGASIMWCVDGFACIIEGEPFIELTDSAVMADDALLGVCVVVLGLVVWGIVCLVQRKNKSSINA